MAQEEAPLAGDGGNCAQTLPSQKGPQPDPVRPGPEPPLLLDSQRPLLDSQRPLLDSQHPLLDSQRPLLDSQRLLLAILACLPQTLLHLNEFRPIRRPIYAE